MQPLQARLPDKLGKTAGLREIATRPRNSAHRRQSDRRASAAGVESAHECAAEPRPPLCRESKSDQAGASGQRSQVCCQQTATRTLATSLRKRIRTCAKLCAAEESLVVIFGEEFRGQAMTDLVAWGLKRGNVRFAFLGDHCQLARRGRYGLSPDLLPGYVPGRRPALLPEYAGLPATPGKTLPEMMARRPKANWAHCSSLARIRWRSCRGSQTALRTHLSWFRTCSSPRRRRWPMWCSRQPASTRNRAPSPIHLAMCSW